jgi:pyridoxal phosphate-dependent aminotransferase EpsN
MAAQNIEVRPMWKPMHQQPVFAGCRVVGGEVADDLFCRGLCLPSGSNLREQDLRRVADALCPLLGGVAVNAA